MVTQTTLGALTDHIATVTLPCLTAKTFRTGSQGFYAQSRVMAGGKHYLVTLQAVEIDPDTGKAVRNGSKATSETFSAERRVGNVAEPADRKES